MIAITSDHALVGNGPAPFGSVRQIEECRTDRQATDNTRYRTSQGRYQNPQIGANRWFGDFSIMWIASGRATNQTERKDQRRFRRVASASMYHASDEFGTISNRFA